MLELKRPGGGTSESREQKFANWLLSLMHLLNNNRGEFGVSEGVVRELDGLRRRLSETVTARDSSRRVLGTRQAAIDELERRYHEKLDELTETYDEAAQAFDEARGQAEAAYVSALDAIGPVVEFLQTSEKVPYMARVSLGLHKEDGFPFRSPAKPEPARVTPDPVSVAATTPPPAPAPVAVEKRAPLLTVARVGDKQFRVAWEDADRDPSTEHRLIVRYRPIKSTMSYRGRVREIADDQDRSISKPAPDAGFVHDASDAALGTVIAFRLVALDGDRERQSAEVELVCS